MKTRIDFTLGCLSFWHPACALVQYLTLPRDERSILASVTVIEFILATISTTFAAISAYSDINLRKEITVMRLTLSIISEVWIYQTEDLQC